MKTKHIQAASLAFAALAAAVLMTGCKTSGYQQADKTGSGIAEFRTEIEKAKTGVDNTLKAMDQIALTATTDPRKAYEQFSKEVSNLDSVANKARKRAEDMRARGQAYFTEWEQQLAQVKDENIRKLAQDRKATLQQSFNKIREVSEPLKEQFDPWMSTLKDLQSYLANDLTIGGITAAKEPFAKAKTNGLAVQKSMDALVTELNTVAAALTPAKVQPTPAPAN